MAYEPTTCSYCHGLGYRADVMARCIDCNGTGEVCNICRKSPHECERDHPSAKDVVRK